MSALVLSLLLADPGLLAQVQARLTPERSLRGTFEQERMVRGLKRPMRSEGVFIVEKGREVRWETRSPAPMVMIVTARTVTMQEGSAAPKIVEVPPEARALLLAVLGGELVGLERAFTVAGVLEEAGWRLTLEPKGDARRLPLRRLELAGGRTIERATLFGKNGEETRVRLQVADAQ